VAITPSATPKLLFLTQVSVSELPQVSDDPPSVMIVVSSVVSATGVAQWFVPTLLSPVSSNWHRFSEPVPSAYQALTRQITPSMVAPAGMPEKSKLYAFSTQVWSSVSKLAGVTLAVLPSSE